ncbi:hypothetical protein [Rhodanobacter lindaniclasticus]
MSPVLSIMGGAALCVLAALLTAMPVAGLRWLARLYGGTVAETLLHIVWFALIGVLVSRSLPLLWPALAPWHSLVAGVSFGLVWAAMRPGMPAHRRRITRTD